MIEESIAARIVNGESVRLTTFDPTCAQIKMLQHRLGSLGRECGVRCLIFPHPTKPGDTGDIKIEQVPLRLHPQVISILQMTPLKLQLDTDGARGTNNTTHQ